MANQIVRVWTGYGTPAGVDRYCREHFMNSVLPHFRSIDGFGRRQGPDPSRTRRNRSCRRHGVGLDRLIEGIRRRELRRSCR